MELIFYAVLALLLIFPAAMPQSPRQRSMRTEATTATLGSGRGERSGSI